MEISYATEGNVTALRQYRKPMKNPILVELLDHWERLRAGRIAPLRSEIDPRQIENALQHAFILERPQSGDIRFRIAGMQLCELMGMEVRAMTAASIIAPESREEFISILDGLFDRPEIIELNLQAARPGPKGLTAEMLLLPMKNEHGEISRILGCLVANGAGTTPPNRFTLLSRKVTRIIATGEHSRKNPVAGFAEDLNVFTPKAPKARGATENRKHTRDYLRLVSPED